MSTKKNQQEFLVYDIICVLNVCCNTYDMDKYSNIYKKNVMARDSIQKRANYHFLLTCVCGITCQSINNNNLNVV